MVLENVLLLALVSATAIGRLALLTLVVAIAFVVMVSFVVLVIVVVVVVVVVVAPVGVVVIIKLLVKFVCVLLIDVALSKLIILGVFVVTNVVAEWMLMMALAELIG